MLVAGLSTGHKLGLGLVGLAFILFALCSSFLFPRVRPDFPGQRGLRVFLVVAIGFFIAMLAAVEVFGKESGEEKGGEKQATAASSKAVQVKEVDFKITGISGQLEAGTYSFEIRNGGPSPHNLAITGPGVNAQSATIGKGKTTTLKATLKKGSYDFFCAVPGHKQAGMDVKVTVG